MARCDRRRGVRRIDDVLEDLAQRLLQQVRPAGVEVVVGIAVARVGRRAGAGSAIGLAAIPLVVPGRIEGARRGGVLVALGVLEAAVLRDEPERVLQAGVGGAGHLERLVGLAAHHVAGGAQLRAQLLHVADGAVGAAVGAVVGFVHQGGAAHADPGWVFHEKLVDAAVHVQAIVGRPHQRVAEAELLLRARVRLDGLGVDRQDGFRRRSGDLPPDRIEHVLVLILAEHRVLPQHQGGARGEAIRIDRGAQHLEVDHVARQLGRSAEHRVQARGCDVGALASRIAQTTVRHRALGLAGHRHFDGGHAARHRHAVVAHRQCVVGQIGNRCRVEVGADRIGVHVVRNACAEVGAFEIRSVGANPLDQAEIADDLAGALKVLVAGGGASVAADQACRAGDPFLIAKDLGQRGWGGRVGDVRKCGQRTVVVAVDATCHCQQVQRTADAATVKCAALLQRIDRDGVGGGFDRIHPGSDRRQARCAVLCAVTCPSLILACKVAICFQKQFAYRIAPGRTTPISQRVRPAVFGVVSGACVVAVQRDLVERLDDAALARAGTSEDAVGRVDLVVDLAHVLAQHASLQIVVVRAHHQAELGACGLVTVTRALAELVQQAGGLVDRSVQLAAGFQVVGGHADLDPCGESRSFGACVIGGSIGCKNRNARRVHVVGVGRALHAIRAGVVVGQKTDGGGVPGVGHLGRPVARPHLGHVPHDVVADGDADLWREKTVAGVRGSAVLGGAPAERDALVHCRGAVEGRQAIEVRAVVVLDEGLAVSWHERLLERGAGGGIAIGRAVGLVGAVGGSQTTIEDLAQHVDSRHGGPVQEIAAPLAGTCGAVVLAVLDRGRRIRLEHPVVGGVVGVALQRIEVAVVAEARLEGVVDLAVEIDVLEVGVGLPEHREVLRGRQHHHRLVRVRRHDVGRNRAQLRRGGADEGNDAERQGKVQFVHG